MTRDAPYDPDGIAVIGMACRFPGAPDTEAFWRNLIDGVESITHFSDEELRLAGVSADALTDPHYVKAAPVLEDYDAFDAEFFGYSPREARLLDPQQRLFLEVAWHTFESAGYDPLGEKGVVGVYAGAGGLVSSQIVTCNIPELRGQTGDLGHIGNDRDFLCPRASFKLNLKGPSINVQTACSTSLVAVHLGCQAIRDGEIDMALAGASVVRVPQISGYVAEPGNIYSPDGHCRAFDARGSGTLFGSGVAAVLLKPLRAALADGDRICAVIRGSAVSNDGAMKVNFTATAAESQARAAVEALAMADVAPDSIGYLECHGTATSIGDPVEIQALTRAFRLDGQPTASCPIGSVKSNFGHLEQCAGIAGLIKSILVLQHGLIPPSLHFEKPNPRIPFKDSPFFVNTAVRELARGGSPRRACVNSLGMGGTNAFMVLEEAPRRKGRRPKGHPLHLLTLSAKSAPALGSQVRNFRRILTGDNGLNLRDLCYTASCGRHHFPHRFSAIGRDGKEILAELDTFANGDRKPTVEATDPARREVVFLYSGQGSQYIRMGHELYRTEPRFRDSLDRCFELFDQAGIPVADAVFGDDDARLRETLYAQPAIFALQVALTELWKAWGVEPDVVIGHSIGEFAASLAANIWSLDDAVRLVAARAKCMQALPKAGKMVSVASDVETIRSVWPNECERAAIAAENAPNSTVVSGTKRDVDRIVRGVSRLGFSSTELNVSHAFHSPLMAPALASLEASTPEIEFRPPTVRWISTLTGAAQTDAPDDGYWSEQIVSPVRFRSAVETVAPSAAVFLEIGPGSVLTRLAQQCVAHADDGNAQRVWASSLSREEGDWRSLLDALRQIYIAGREIRWDRFEPAGGRRVALPTYPFERKRWTLETGDGHSDRIRSPAPLRAGRDHPLLGRPIASDGRRFEALIGLEHQPFLVDHKVFDTVVLPTTAALDAVTSAAVAFLGFSKPVISDFLYQQALTLASPEPAWCQTVFERKDDVVSFRMESAGMDVTGDWQVHVTGTIREASNNPHPPAFSVHGARRDWPEIPRERYYRFLQASGLSYGPVFQGISHLWKTDDNALAKVAFAAEESDSRKHVLHPAFLDACLHIYPALLQKYGLFEDRDRVGPAAYVPISLDAFQIYRSGVTDAWVHARVLSREGSDEARLKLDIDVYGEDGEPVARFAGVTIQETTADLMLPDRPASDRFLYELHWEQVSEPKAATELPERWFIFADGQGVGEQLAERLEAEGHGCTVVVPDGASASTVEHAVTLDPSDPSGFQDLLAGIGATRSGIVYLWPLRAMPEDGALAEPTDDVDALVCGGALSLAKAIDSLRADGAEPPRVWLVSQGVHSGENRVSQRAVLQSPLWGFGRTFALELPDAWGGLVDLPPSDDGRLPDFLWQEIMARDGERQVTWRDGGRFSLRLTRANSERRSDPPKLTKNATYWIVGGLGDVGLATAAALVEGGARHLVLSGRKAKAPKTASAIANLRKHAEIVVLPSDVTQEADVYAVLDHIDQDLPPLKGIVHAAAVFEDAVLSNTAWPQFQRVLAPKIRGAWVLHKCTAQMKLDFFVLYSSVLSLFGGEGQAAYTAANSFLDTLAHARRDAGLPATVCNWGPWATANSTRRLGKTGTMVWKRRGTTPLPPEAYLGTLLSSLNQGPAQLIAADTDWSVFLDQFKSAPSLYRALVSGHRRSAAEADRDERPLAAAEKVEKIVCDVLGVGAPMDANRPLNELGLDSLLAVNLVNRLSQDLGITVAAATLLKGVSINQLVAEIAPESESSAESIPAADSSIERTEGNGWLIFPRYNPAAKVRLVCFPFAGGGAATFRAWTDTLDSSIEVLAIEPPGRQTRIDERPIRDMETFMGALIPELLPYLDKPFAVYGHCLGALTAYEAVRRLIGEHGAPPIHVFVSGARPPDELQRQQDFETGLLERLLKLPDYSLFDPVYQQPDEVFAEAILSFNIPATEALLSDPELRHLMLPVIRAEFEMSSRYRHAPEAPWDIPITSVSGNADVYATKENAQSWNRFTKRRFQLLELDSEHFLVVDDDQFLIEVLNRELANACESRPTCEAAK